MEFYILFLLLSFSTESGHSLQMVCSITEDVCDGECYDPLSSVCIDGRGPCELGQSICRNTCYWPDSQVCSFIDDWQGRKRIARICPTDQIPCGVGKCFNPASNLHLHCTRNSLCQTTEEGCGGICFDPTSGHKCFDGILCQYGEERCARECYDPASFKCFDGIICERYEEICLSECYNPKNGSTCVAGNICLPDGDNWCGNKCFDPQTESCLESNMPESIGPTICLINQELCGESCYWRHIEICNTIGEELSNLNYILCPIGQKPCGDSRCYDPEYSNCFGNQICSMGRHLCGNECFNPNKHTACYNNTIVAVCGDQESCGNECFDPQLYKCVEYEPAGDYDKIKVINEKKTVGFTKFLEIIYGFLPIPAILVSAVGIIGNILNVLVLSRKEMTSPSSRVLLGLACFDTVLLGSLMMWYALSFRQTFDTIISESMEPIPAVIGLPLMRTAYTGSVYTTVLITLERYFAICWPLQSRESLTLKTSSYGILAVLTLSILINSPRYFETLFRGGATVIMSASSECYMILKEKYCEDETYSVDEWRSLDDFSIYYEGVFWFTVMYAIPFLVVSVLNFLIVKKMQLSNFHRASMTASRNTEDPRNTTDPTKMLLTVVLVFVICNALNCSIVIFALSKWGMTRTVSEQVSNFTLVINSSINFVIYCLMGTQFRKVLKIMLSSWFNCCVCKGGAAV